MVFWRQDELPAQSEPSSTATAVTCPALPSAADPPKDHLAVAAGQMGGDRLKAGRLFVYKHDGIGNRDWAVLGGPARHPDNASGVNETAYTANAKNQITDITNPGAAHVSGYAPADSRVEITCGGSTFPAVPDGTYWYAAVPVDNASGPVCAVIEVTITDEAGNETVETITRLVPKESESSSEIDHDVRGNKTEDSLWEYTWDEQDRLKSAAMKAVTGADRVKVVFQYDPWGRRATKTVFAEVRRTDQPVPAADATPQREGRALASQANARPIARSRAVPERPTHVSVEDFVALEY